MKKLITVFIIAAMAFTALSACGDSEVTNVDEKKKLSIVTTIFPEYDWVLNVLGDNPAGAEVTMLLDNGVDLHSYQPTAKDIVNIANCDLLIYVGGESDEWVEDALENAENKDIIAINLLEVLGDAAKEEEMVEGMQEVMHDHDHDDHDEDADHDDHDEDSDHDEHDHDEHDHDDAELDEHVWLSLRNASTLVGRISEALQSLDSTNAETYSKNADAYIEKINALDGEYEEAVSASPVKTLLFGDRFPFRYLTDDYGLSYYAAFVGCSSETEASFDTILFLANKVDELNLGAVLTIEGAKHKIAETVIKNTEAKNQKILTLDSMQSTMASDLEKGSSYLSIMEENLEVLKEALK